MKDNFVPVRLHEKTVETLKIMRDKGESIADVVDAIMISAGHMTKEGEPSKVIKEALDAKRKAVARLNADKFEKEKKKVLAKA